MEVIEAVKAGEIFASSWGWEQTNVNYYRVVEAAEFGKFAKLQEIGKQMVESSGYSSMAGKCVPNPAAEVGPIIRKKVLGQKYGQPSFKMASYERAYKWSGKPEYVSWYA